MPAGTGATSASSTTTSSAYPPQRMCAITRSPGMKPCTPSPTCLTTPAISVPGEKGRSGLNWYLFWMRRTSGKFTPLAFTDTKSCPLPGFGEGMSSTTSASGGPHVLHRTAFTRVLLRSCRHHSRLVASATIVGLPCSVPRGGFHDRRHCQARAQVRRILETPGRFDHRYHHPGCDHRADRNRNFRTRLSGTRHAGKNAGGRHLGPADPAACRGDPAMALSQRHARADADVGEDRRCRYVGAGVDAQAGHTGGRAPGDVDSDHSAGGSTLDRLRQAQAGVARQTCRDRGDPGRGRLNPRSLTTGTHARKGEDMSWGFWIVVGIVAAAVVWLISIYNALVARRNRFKNAFAQIDVQLKRRYDLIPNLVETAKGYIKHERGTLEAVIAARNGAQSANQRAAANPADAEAMKHMAAAEAGLSGALGRLFALFEAYPDLKANQTMMQLSEELTSTENKISFARQAYNDAVMSYNTGIESFPDNFVAGFGGFKEATLLESTESPEERKPVKVSFG